MKIITLTSLIALILMSGCSKDEAETTSNTQQNTNSTSISNTTNVSSLPGDNFNLETLQIETSWNTPDRSTVSETASTFNPTDFFYMEDNNMVFESKESDGKRTELKERPGEEKDLNVYKKLEYTAKVDLIPENGVTIAQVHNRGNGVERPLVRVYIDNDLKIKFKLSNNPIDTSTYTTITGPEYIEGSILNVTVLIENGVTEFSVVTTSGTKNHTFTPSINWNSYATSYYLKAGVYTEGNDTRPKISFSEFVLTK
ncbi:polysaccharide lyase family 7 protein [uncultured Lacinutrix sp.]|uniref:polysaccharide lyase family 7 protein n=1 Tax=uncultured Lacinutrix sp. TaxID=574032 RepID=UPI00262243D4|nr:polysaccharide lyase family 7 protein [uncultured Lacinutrix sp.]